MLYNDTLTPTRNEELTIGTTAQEISMATNDRKVIVIRNNSTNGAIITLSFGNKAPISGQGIVLNQGYSVTDVISAGYLPYQGQILAISDIAGGKLSIFER